MGVGQCNIVRDDEAAGDGANEGDVIFMKIGPVNLMPFVDSYETENAELFGNRLQSILKNKREADPKKLIKKEHHIIHSQIQIPCRVTYLPNRLGKIPSVRKNTIFMEYDNFLSLRASYLPDTLHDNEDFKTYLRRDKLLDSFADQFLL